MVEEPKDEQPAEGEGKEQKKKKGTKLVLIIVIAVAVLAGGAGAFFFVSKSSGKGEKKEEAPKEESVMFALEPFVVNLSDQSGTRFLKVSMQLELSGPAIMEKAKAKTPQLRDAVITLLTGKTSDNLMSPEGKLQLKDEINIVANQILGDNAVKNAFLTEFVMQ